MKKREPLFFWDGLKQSFTERKVVFLLSIFALLLSFLPMIWETYFNPEPILIVKEHLANQVENNYKNWKIEQSQNTPFIHNNDRKKRVKNYEKDINLAEWKDLVSQGISSKSANILLKYRRGIGVFKDWKTVMKSYGLNSAEKNILQKQFELNKTSQNEISIGNDATVTTKIIDLNLSSKEELMKMRGIGNYYANKIILYRTYLGGFHSMEQVAEIRGIPDSVFLKVKEQSLVSNNFKTINLKESTAIEIAKHPYLNMKQAKRIKAYLLQHSTFADLEKFQSVTLMSDEDLEKIAPYLNFQ